MAAIEKIGGITILVKPQDWKRNDQLLKSAMITLILIIIRSQNLTNQLSYYQLKLYLKL